MPTPDHDLPRTWITAGHSRLWGTQGTYTRIASERLPALPVCDESFAWLAELPDRDYAATLDNDDIKLQSLPQLQQQLSGLGLALPADFLKFIRTPELYGRIPTCTDCYLELSDTVAELPGFPGCHAVRFMNDSQCCVLWHLLFQPGHPVRVLATSLFLEPAIFTAMQYTDDDDQPLPYEQALEDACLCAESFGEFICRFGIENMLWFALHTEAKLSPIEQRYLEEAK